MWGLGMPVESGLGQGGWQGEGQEGLSDGRSRGSEIRNCNYSCFARQDEKDGAWEQRDFNCSVVATAPRSAAARVPVHCGRAEQVHGSRDAVLCPPGPGTFLLADAPHFPGKCRGSAGH